MPRETARGGPAYEIKLHRFLRHTNSGVPERSSAAKDIGANYLECPLVEYKVF